MAQKTHLLSNDPQSVFYLEGAARKSAAVLPDLTLVIAKAHRASIIYSDLKNRGNSAGTPIRAVKTVELSFLEKLNAPDALVDVAVDMTRNQKILYRHIEEAAKLRASDIHITIETDKATLARTINNDFLVACELPVREAWSVVQAAFNACKTGDQQFNQRAPRSARLDSSEDFVLPPGLQALRMEFTPGDNNSHRTVGRLIYADSDDVLRDIDSLGYRKPQLNALAVMRRQPYGIILISGPTGSGKSTTLKTALEKMWADKLGRINIITIEDPPEFHVKGAFQIPVVSGATDEDRRQGFRRAMSSMLRMAPNVGMVGEIRDSVAATLTFDMAKTGHLVWASVHANTAIDSIIRVRDMEVSMTDLKDPMLVRGLIAQRLIKSLCPHCACRFDDRAERAKAQDGAPPIDPDTEAFYLGLDPALRSRIRMARPGGCDHCKGPDGSVSTGHKGRKVVAETIVPTRDLLAAVLADKPDQARSMYLEQPGSVGMIEHALWRVLIGECDPRDVSEKAGDVSMEIDKKRIPTIMERLTD